MGIELRKSIPDPELNSRIWGTTINPESYYRALGETGADGWSIYDDVLRTGQVRGSPSFGGDAYFSKGAPQGIYLHNQSNLKDVLQHWSEAEAGNNNFLIEATNRFNPETNPLYNPSPKDFVYDGTIESTKGRVGYSKWMTTDPATGKPVPTGTYSYVSPRQWNDSNAPSFLQRINPANQRGLKMSQAYTPSWQGATRGFEEPVTWKNLFDYTKDFKNTSIPQHGRNALHIGRTVLSQPETQAVIAGAGKYGLPAVAVAMTPVDALSRRDKNFTDFYERTRRDPTTTEDIGLRLKSGIEPALAFATLGAYDAIAETPTYKAYLDQEQRDRAEAMYRQHAIDYPVISGYQTERTTK